MPKLENCRTCKRKMNVDAYNKALAIGLSPIEVIKRIDAKLNMSDLYKEPNGCCIIEYTSYLEPI